LDVPIGSRPPGRSRLPGPGGEGGGERVIGLAELDGGVRAQLGQRVERLLVAPGRDDAAGAVVPRGLDRQLAGDPVAPRMSAVWPGCSGHRQPNASHADSPGFHAAAAIASSRPSGMGKVIWGLATEYCAIVPHREPDSTRWPPGRRPAPITPGTAGRPPAAYSPERTE
jgi:hypothetical protein